MKKILLVALVAVVWFSCKKSSSSNANSNLLGKWYIAGDSTADYTNGTLVDHSSEVITDRSTYFLFNNNGSGSVVTTSNNETSSLNYTYKVSDNTLTFNFPQQVVGTDTVYASTQTATITILTSSKFQFETTQTETDNGITYKSYEQDDFVR